MIATIRNIGNSKGIIIPKSFIEKFHFLKTVTILETEDGLMITPTEEKSLYETKLAQLKLNKKQLYALMTKQAQDKKTIDYYNNQLDLGDIDLEILD